jgi:hypothetical protein
MLKRYINTFRGSEPTQRFRRFGFTIFTLVMSLLISIYFAVMKTFDNQFLALLTDLSIGLIIAIIVDNIAGIGRKSPLL